MNGIRFRSGLAPSATAFAAANGYGVLPHPHQHAYDPDGRIAAFCQTEPSWSVPHAYLRSRYESGTFLIDGRDARVLLWKWRLGKGGVDELMLTFGRDLKLLTEEAYWLRFLPFLAADPESGGFTVTLPEPRMERFAGEYFMLGGKSNWGHWLVDHLAQSHFLDVYPWLRDKTLVVNAMKPWQRETLDHFGLDKVLEIDCDGMAGLFEFERLWVVSGWPLPARIDHLRSRLAGRGTPTRRRLYLSRALMAPQTRVANEDEVQSVLCRRGFEVVFPEKMSLAEKIEAFGGAEIIANAPGSASLNYLLFARRDAISINFAPSFMGWDNPPANWAMGSMAYMVPGLDSTVNVYGRLPPGIEAHVNIDTNEYYAPDELNAAIDRAEAMRGTGP
ncbi:MAG: glycosyltransferase family 61 protein [Alphaproteobacteria bacterium]|nr:glycosyltransferase family 61 protein [Alphaproteobacteria bacterium]